MSAGGRSHKRIRRTHAVELSSGTATSADRARANARSSSSILLPWYSCHRHSGMRYFNFTAIELVHVGTPPAAIISVAKSRIEYTDDDGQNLNVDFEECARIYGCLRQLGAFPPDESTNWGELVDSVPDFATLPLPIQPVVGLRGAIDKPPWFQFLNRRRTQFEFKDYEHIQHSLLAPLASTGIWRTWDAS